MDDAAVLTESALADIVLAIDRADVPEDFFAEVDAIMGKHSNLLPLPLDLGQVEPLKIADGSTRRDVDNGPLVFEYLGALDPSNAADPRLWTYLALSTYREYMSHRWPVVGKRNWRRRLKDRWVMQSPSRQNLVRNGIARLWWVTSLTFDGGLKGKLAADTRDQFAYARVAFALEDVVVGLFERELGSLDSVARAVLQEVHDNELSGNDVKDLMKELTLVYGYRDIEILNEREVRELIKSFVSDEARSRAA